MIEGRIVHAIANTTAKITGFAYLQLLTLLNSDDISLVKNCFFNTEFNIYQFFSSSKRMDCFGYY